MQAVRKQTVPTLSRTRSAVTNNPWTLPGVDMRSASGRLFRDLCHKLATEIGGELSLAEQFQVRAAATCLVRAAEMQDDVVNGKPVSVDEVVRLSSESRRILAPIMAKAAARKPAAVPSLSDYLASRGDGAPA